MQRRDFWLTLVGAAGIGLAGRRLSATENSAQCRYFLLHTLHLKDAAQCKRMHAFLRDGLLPAMGHLHPGPVLCLEALVAQHTPQIAWIAGFPSLDSLLKVRASLRNEATLASGLEPCAAGDGQPSEAGASTVLEAAGNSPQFAVPAALPPSSRIFELRVYQFPTRGSNPPVRECFAGPGIFQRAGIQLMLYASTLAGTGTAELACLILFDDLAAREKAWNAFAAGPEWEDLRRRCIARRDRGPRVVRIALYRATDYSPLR